MMNTDEVLMNDYRPNAMYFSIKEFPWQWQIPAHCLENDQNWKKWIIFIELKFGHVHWLMDIIVPYKHQDNWIIFFSYFFLYPRKNDMLLPHIGQAIFVVV